MKNRAYAIGLVSFVSGAIFAAGLALSGMTQPGKVTSFLDFTGFWDPSLAFVMAGAIAVYFFGHRKILKKKRPLFEEKFDLPTAKRIDGRLLSGAAIFGAGWGLAGFCPGPALASLVTFRFEVLLFVASMALGMLLFEFYEKRRKRR